MKKRKKARLKKENIFIFGNIVILFVITCFYAFRLFHFYRIEHPKVKEKETLSSLVTLKKNVVSLGDGLYQNDDGYVFQGKDVHNYVSYSGRLWRIVSVLKDGSVKMITEDSQTLLVWGKDSDYEKSYVRSWLNRQDGVSRSGIFYDSLNHVDTYLKKGTFCIDITSENNNKCDKTVEDMIGLLSKGEYDKAGGKDSYLNIGEYFWTSNASVNGPWYVYSRGKLNDAAIMGNVYYSYGVRPVVVLKETVEVLSGDGSKEKPYVIEKETGSTLLQKNVGDYIEYSGNVWRIIERDSNYVKVVLGDVLKVSNDIYKRPFNSINNIYSGTSGTGYYLNSIFYKTLEHPEYLVEGTIYTSPYDATTSYDYRKIYGNSTKVKVGLLQVGDLFLNDTSDYFLATRTSTYENTVYKVVDEGKLYADLISSEASVRPVLFLKADLGISGGNGTKEKPYVLK